MVTLARPPDSTEYAHHLYSTLRQADETGVQTVVAVLPPDDAIGNAVRDRLRRAAHRSVPE